MNKNLVNIGIKAKKAARIKIDSKSKNKVLVKFLYYYLKGISLPNLGYSRHFKELVRLKISLPTINIQKEIVKNLSEIDKIIDLNSELINKTQKKLKNKIKSIWSN